MRHDDHRARPLLEIALQPFDALEIQVIRRLIQQQEIRLLQQEARQQGAGLLAAAEIADGLLILGLGEAQAAQHPLDAGLVGVAARALKGIEPAAIASHRVLLQIGIIGRHRCLEATQLGLLRVQLREDRVHRLPQRRIALEIRRLRKVAQSHIPRAMDLALVGDQVTGDQIQ